MAQFGFSTETEVFRTELYDGQDGETDRRVFNDGGTFYKADTHREIIGQTGMKTSLARYIYRLDVTK